MNFIFYIFFVFFLSACGGGKAEEEHSNTAETESPIEEPLAPKASSGTEQPAKEEGRHDILVLSPRENELPRAGITCRHGCLFGICIFSDRRHLRCKSGIPACGRRESNLNAPEPTPYCVIGGDPEEEGAELIIVEPVSSSPFCVDNAGREGEDGGGRPTCYYD